MHLLSKALLTQGLMSLQGGLQKMTWPVQSSVRPSTCSLALKLSFRGQGSNVKPNSRSQEPDTGIPESHTNHCHSI